MNKPISRPDDRQLTAPDNYQKYGLALAPLWMTFHNHPHVSETEFVVLANIFKDVDQSKLARAVMAHMRESEWMPKPKHLQDQLVKIIAQDYSPIVAQMIRAGYTFVGDQPAGGDIEGMMAYVFNDPQTNNIIHLYH